MAVGRGVLTTTSTSVFRPILWPVLVPSLLFATGIGATVPVLAIAAIQIGASQSFAAAIVGLMGAVSLVCTVPAGIVIDRLGDARAMLVATACAVLVYGVTVLSLVWDSPHALWLYVASLMLMAPIRDSWSLARQSVVAEVMPAAHIGKAMTALGGTLRAGALIGPVVSAGLLLILPTWSAFAFATVAAIAAVALMYLPSARLLDAEAVRLRDEAVRRQRASRRAQAAPGSWPEHQPSTPTQGDGGAVRWSAVSLAGASVAMLALARAVHPVVIQLWGLQIGLDSSQVSLLIALGAALELIIMFPGAYTKDRLGRVTSLVICLGVFAGGYVVMAALPTPSGLVIAVVVMAVGNGMGAGINMTIGADLSPAIGRAKFLGVWAIFTNIGRVGGPAVVSAVIVVASLQTAILASGAFAGAGAVWILAFARRIGLPSRMPSTKRSTIESTPQ